jgi:hypothetical protein
MKFRFASACGLAAFLAVVATATVASTPAPPAPLTVHEWGTFTSIAGADGAALQWSPQGGQSDLPCFVERSVFNVKGWLVGTVRMETPVLYFYAPQPVSVNVDVAFHDGLMTEWYPHATAGGDAFGTSAWEGWLTWTGVRVSPGLPADFPSESRSSHYYAARETDAAPVQAGPQKERFLFYRGVGRFAPPLMATIADDGSATVWNRGDLPLGDLILFSNRGGTIAFTHQRAAASRTVIARPAVDDDVTVLKRDLERILVNNGLYRREAEAMVATWSDSWFEEGTRLFYIAPRRTVDEVLPLTIVPAPRDLQRVFVGRIELATAETRQSVRRALLAGDGAALARYGRFLQPIGARAIEEGDASERPLLATRLNAASAQSNTPQPSCR